jgi:tetratricopeptide (TPR) repeat protein
MQVNNFVFVLGIIFSINLLSCSNPSSSDQKSNTNQDSVKIDRSKSGLLKQIKLMEDSLFSSTTLDKNKGNRAIAMYQEFHKYYWQDTICVDFLFKAAEISDNMGYPQKAIELYQECFDYYPYSSLAPYCLFRVGNIFQFTIHDYLNAKIAYNDCIKFFPKSDAAKDAKELLKIESKSDNELIKEFEKINASKSKN